MSADPNTRLQFLENVRDAWALLPAFRAVAETEHLPTAARELGLVPSSLSRDIRQLEETVGVELFHHSGKALVLNERGRMLLDSVRVAMRQVDEGVRAASGRELEGTVTLAIADQLPSSLVGSACLALHRDYPDLALSVVGVDEKEVDNMLLRGGADLAVVTTGDRHSDVSVLELRALPRGAYIAREMKDADVSYVGMGTRQAPIADGWPPGRQRRIAIWAHCERVAIDMCLQGGFAFVATEHSVAKHADRLVRLPITDIAPQPAYVAFRRPLGKHARTEAAVSAVMASCAERTPSV